MTNFLKTPADGQSLPAEFFAEVRAFDQLYITSDRRQALEKKYKINTETLLKGLVNHISEAAIATISNFHVGVAGLGSSYTALGALLSSSTELHFFIPCAKKPAIISA